MAELSARALALTRNRACTQQSLLKPTFLTLLHSLLCHPAAGVRTTATSTAAGSAAAPAGAGPAGSMSTAHESQGEWYRHGLTSLTPEMSMEHVLKDRLGQSIEVRLGKGGSRVFVRCCCAPAAPARLWASLHLAADAVQLCMHFPATATVNCSLQVAPQTQTLFVKPQLVLYEMDGE